MEKSVKTGTFQGYITCLPHGCRDPDQYGYRSSQKRGRQLRNWNGEKIIPCQNYDF